MGTAYRETLTRLQEAAPPLPPRPVHRVLARELGTEWRDRFREFADVPAARILDDFRRRYPRFVASGTKGDFAREA